MIEALLADLAPLVKTILPRSFANLMLQRTTPELCLLARVYGDHGSVTCCLAFTVAYGHDGRVFIRRNINAIVARLGYRKPQVRGADLVGFVIPETANVDVQNSLVQF